MLISRLLRTNGEKAPTIGNTEHVAALALDIVSRCLTWKGLGKVAVSSAGETPCDANSFNSEATLLSGIAAFCRRRFCEVGLRRRTVDDSFPDRFQW